MTNDILALWDSYRLYRHYRLCVWCSGYVSDGKMEDAKTKKCFKMKYLKLGQCWNNK